MALHGKPTFMIGRAEDSSYEEHLKEGKYFVLDDVALDKYKKDPRVIFIAGSPIGNEMMPAIMELLRIERSGRAAEKVMKTWDRLESLLRYHYRVVGDRAMESKAKLLGHPIHQMLIVFPLGLLGTAVIFDIVALTRRNAEWSTVAFYMIGAGIVGGLIAAIFGLIDWLAISSGTRAKSIGLWHGGGNVIVILLFAGSWILRRSAPDNPDATALALSFLGLLLALVTGWLGGELVDRLGVGVAPGAHLNAPSSLSNRPASDNKSST